MEERLALWLSDGPSAVSEVFARSGWQSRATQNGRFDKGRRSGLVFRGSRRLQKNFDDDALLDDVAVEGPTLDDPLLVEVAEVLQSSKDYIKQLWDHPTVVDLFSRTELQLNERSEL